MKYMGSKRLLAKELVPVIEGMLDLGKCRDYVEPFVGGCNMIDKIKAEGVRRHGYDNNRYLIAMLSCLDAVEKEMPDEMPREEYEAVRADYNAGGGDYADWYTGAVGFLASRSGRFFDGGFSGILTDKDGKTRNYYLEAKRNVLAQAPLLKDVEFGFGDYRETCSKYEGAVIYCDPPYKGTKQYNTSRNFDYEAFWDWCRMMATKNIVLVSEQTAPDEPWIETLWEQDVKRAINHSDTKKATEKLFLVRGEFYDKCWARRSTDCRVPKDMLFPERADDGLINAALSKLPPESFPRKYCTAPFAVTDREGKNRYCWQIEGGCGSCEVVLRLGERAEAHPNLEADARADLRMAEELCIKCGDPANDGKCTHELLAEVGRIASPGTARPNTAADYGMPEEHPARPKFCAEVKPPKGMARPLNAAVSVGVEWTNWDIYMDKILERCAQGMCFDCLARRTCERLCRERNIDVTLTKPPCAEAWRVWAAEPCNDGKKDV